MAKWQTFQENWASNSNVLGGLYTSYFGTTAITGNQCVYTISSGALNYEGFQTANTYNLTDSYFFMQLVDAGNQSLLSFEIYLCQLKIDSNNRLYFYMNQGAITANYVVGGSFVTVGSPLTYNSTLHKYFRIKEKNGVIYWDYSQDGISWTNLASVATPITITALLLELSAGQWNNEVAGTTCITGNMNTVDTNKPGNLIRRISVGDGVSMGEVAN